MPRGKKGRTRKRLSFVATSETRPSGAAGDAEVSETAGGAAAVNLCKYLLCIYSYYALAFPCKARTRYIHSLYKKVFLKIN